MITATDLPVIPGFDLFEPLGQGGMGVVYKARQTRLGRYVAIKLIRQDRLAHPDAVKRFQKEVQAAARLEHPNVVRVFEAGRLGNRYYLVMEYVDGVDLARLVGRQGPLPIVVAVDCIRQAALALDHLHEIGLVHRDVKPGNLLATWRAGGVSPRRAVSPEQSSSTPGANAPGSPFVVKLTDLGLARLLELEAEMPGSTPAGGVVGTPDFVAPEQIEDPRHADIRADLYSLGCTAYFLLTGQPPFPGGTMIQKLDRHRWSNPTPLRDLRSDVPTAVAAVVDKLLAKSPTQRYQTPAKLAAALQDMAPSLSAASSAIAPDTPLPSDLQTTVAKKGTAPRNLPGNVSS